MENDEFDVAPSPMVEETRAQIEPLMKMVIDQLDADGNAYPMAFFTQMLIVLRTTRAEPEMLQLFFDLSTTAFQGFVFSPEQAATVDQLLARCEAIAFAMTADDASPH